MTDRNTIFALSSGAGAAGIAVIRISGPAAAVALQAMSGLPPGPPRAARLARLRDPESGEMLDRGLVLWFPGPGSATGEDVAELQVHGGRAVIAGVLEALAKLPGLRPAEPGEFTRRAFENGLMDLTAAEGIADLVAAETAAQRRQALEQAGGGLAALYDAWRRRLVRVLSHLEAEIDFPEEGLPEGIAAEVRGEVQALEEAIGAHLEDGRRGERLREGFTVAIVGAPNVGKSSLLNRLARREAAIVSETAGTTRDVIEVHLDLGGLPVMVADTAGLREVAGDVVGSAIETEGIRRARARAEAADLRLAVFEAGIDPDSATLALVDERTVVVVNKCDRGGAVLGRTLGGRPALAVSALTGAGLDGLLERLEGEVNARWGSREGAALTRLRHRRGLEEARRALARAGGGGAVELVAEDLRLAARAIGRITGRVDVEDILDVIFRDFCIGK